ncbi:MAG TPA: alpha/beta fold hydrolase [Pseudomonadales bacterium]
MKTVSCLLLLCCLTLGGCSRFFFFPEAGISQTPADLGYRFDSRLLATGDGSLINVWRIDSATRPSLGAILFFHGNSLNMGHHFAQVRWLVDAGYDVMMMDYRGFGLSQGSPNLRDSLADIRQVTALFLAEFPAEQPRFFLAQSLGATMAGRVIAMEPGLRAGFNGVILDSAFTGFNDQARFMVGGGQGWSWIWDFPAALLTPMGHDLDDVIERIAPTPLLILHSVNDRLIAFHNAEKLYRKAGQPKKLLVFDNHDHLQTLFQPDARRELALFMDSQLSPAQLAMRQAASDTKVQR